MEKMRARIWTKAQCKQSVKELLQGVEGSRVVKDDFLVKVFLGDELLFSSTYREKNCLVRIQAVFLGA